MGRSDTTPPVRPLPVGRVVAIVCIFAWMVVGPVLGQGFHVNRPYLTAWHMFRTWGTGIMSVQYYQRTDGSDVALDRAALLGHASMRFAGRDRIVAKTEKVQSQAERICAALGNGADVRADVYRGTLHEWVPVMQRERNLCRR